MINKLVGELVYVKYKRFSNRKGQKVIYNKDIRRKAVTCSLKTNIKIDEIQHAFCIKTYRKCSLENVGTKNYTNFGNLTKMITNPAEIKEIT